MFPFEVLISGDTGASGIKVLSVEYSKVLFKILICLIFPIESDNKSRVASEAMVDDDPTNLGSFLYDVPPDTNWTSPMASCVDLEVVL